MNSVDTYNVRDSRRSARDLYVPVPRVGRSVEHRHGARDDRTGPGDLAVSR